MAYFNSSISGVKTAARKAKQQATAYAQRKICPPQKPCPKCAPATWTILLYDNASGKRFGSPVNVTASTMDEAYDKLQPTLTARGFTTKEVNSPRPGILQVYVRTGQLYGNPSPAGTRIVVMDANNNIMGTLSRTGSEAELKAYITKILAGRNVGVKFGTTSCCDPEGYAVIVATAIPKGIPSQPRPAPAPAPSASPMPSSELKSLGALRYVRVVQKTGPRSGTWRIYKTSRSVMNAVARARMLVNDWGKNAQIPPEIVIQAGSRKSFEGPAIILARYRYENGSWRLTEGGVGIWSKYWEAHKRNW